MHDYLRRYCYNIFVVISFILFSLISVSLLWHTHMLLGGSDLQFHARRLTELEKSFSNLNLFPQFSFNEFHGAADMVMYPYLNLFPIIILSFFIKSPINLIYIFFIVNIFVCFLISYYCSLKYSKSCFISYIFSLTYGMSTLYLDYGFSSMDFGVLSALTFLPLVIFGFISLIKIYEWKELTIGISLIFFSHILSVVIVSGFLFIWLILNFKSIDRKIVFNLSKAILLTILITSIIWVPIIHIFVLNLGNISSPGGFDLYGTSFKSLILGSITGNVTYGISILAIIGLVFSVLFYNHLQLIDKQMLFISLFTVIMCSKFIPWYLTNNGPLKLFKGFQFTWRFYIIPQIFLCYLFSECIYRLLLHIKYKKLILIGLMALIIILQLISQSMIIHNDSTGHPLTRSYINSHTIITNTMVHRTHLRNISLLTLPWSQNIKLPTLYKIKSAKQYHLMVNPYVSKLKTLDYFPMSSFSRIKTINDNKAIYNGNKHLSFVNVGYNKFLFNLNNKSYNEKNRVELPIVYYRGEHLHIFMNDKLYHYHISKYNTIIINNIKRGNNRLYIKTYNNNILIILTYMIFGAGVLWLLLSEIRKYKFRY